MPPRWSANLSAADDGSTLLEDLGSRFATCVYTTSDGAGFDTMTTAIMLPGGNADDPRLPVDLAGEIIRRWRGTIGRVFLEGNLAWCGRVSRITIAAVRDDGTCAVQIDWRGLVYDLERESPELDGTYTDEFSTVSASELIELVVGQSRSPIAHRFERVARTAVNIGPVQTSVQDTSLSLILNQLKGASASGVEYAFLVYDPDDGPWLVPLGLGAARYRINLADAESAGLSVVWDLSEYVSDARAAFTNGDSNSDATEEVSSALGIALHNGLRAYRSIAVDAVNTEGAEAARDAFLALHQDPLAVTGSFDVQDYISTDEGGTHLAGLVRAGDIVNIADMLPFDDRLDHDGRSHSIASTSYDVFSGSLSMTLDQRAISSRQNERMTSLRVLARSLEPGLSHGLLDDGFVIFDVAKVVPKNVSTALLDDQYEFTAVRTMRIQMLIVLTINDRGGVESASDSRWHIGVGVDDEGWDFQEDQDGSVDYLRQGVSGGAATLTGHPRPKKVDPGLHRIQLYAQYDAGDYEVTVARVFFKS